MATNPAALHRGQWIRPSILIALVLVVGASVLAGFALGRRTSSGSSTLPGSGRAVTQTRDLPPFTAIDLAGSNVVSIRVGAQQRVTVQADDNLIDLVSTRVTDGVLVIDNHRNYTPETPMSVLVTVPRLDSVSLSGSGTVSVEGVQARALSVRLPGSGIVRVAGTTDRLEATLNGSGELLLGDLLAHGATAIIEGSGVIQLSASDALRASIPGSGTISYTGGPDKVSKSVTGSGAIVGA